MTCALLQSSLHSCITLTILKNLKFHALKCSFHPPHVLSFHQVSVQEMNYRLTNSICQRVETSVPSSEQYYTVYGILRIITDLFDRPHHRPQKTLEDFSFFVVHPKRAKRPLKPQQWKLLILFCMVFIMIVKRSNISQLRLLPSRLATLNHGENFESVSVDRGKENAIQKFNLLIQLEPK